jgi:hypothetical protein
MSAASDFLSLEKVCLEMGLYEKTDIHPQSESHLKNFYDSVIYGEGFDAYCVHCKRESHFKVSSRRSSVDSLAGVASNPNLFITFYNMHNLLVKGHFNCVLECARDRNHKMEFYFRFEEGCIYKIGQYPSLADLQIPKVQKYKKLLSEYYPELTKAIGLNAHVTVPSVAVVGAKKEAHFPSVLPNRRE